MLVVDKNFEFSRREQAEWLEHGIATIRVDSMQEAIEKLNKEEFFIVAINADNIKYLPLLRVMRDITPMLIFVISSNITAKEYKEALDNGADVYCPFFESAKENVQMGMAMINRHSERNAQPRKPVKIIAYQELLVYPKFNKVYCHDEEIDLTKIEYDIYHYLISNPNQPLSVRQIYRKVWGRDSDEASHQTLWQHISRIRKKFQTINHTGCIENRRGMGYCFTTAAKN